MLGSYRQLFGELHVFTATAVNNLALLLQAQGKLAEAEVELRRALRVFQNLLGQAHDDTVAAMRSLVELLWERTPTSLHPPPIAPSPPPALAPRRCSLTHTRVCARPPPLFCRDAEEKIEEAKEALTMQLSLQAQLPDTEHRWMAQGCAGLGSLQWQLGNRDEAYRSFDASSQCASTSACTPLWHADPFGMPAHGVLCLDSTPRRR